MNKNELHGGARYLGGKVEKAVGDTVGSHDWQVDGVVDQVAGATENAYGRARSVAEDVVDAAPGLAKEARETLHDAAVNVGDAARRGGNAVNETVRENPAIWGVAAAAIVGYAVSWLVHGRRA